MYLEVKPSLQIMIVREGVLDEVKCLVIVFQRPVELFGKSDNGGFDSRTSLCRRRGLI